MDQDRERLNEVKESIEGLLTFDLDTMYNREDWGKRVSLDQYKSDFDYIFYTAKAFSGMPYDLLDDSTLEGIKNTFDNAAAHFETIDEYDLYEEDNSIDGLYELGKSVNDHCSVITRILAPWLPYLAYQRGDVAENIAKIESAIGQADTLVENAKTHVDGQKEKIKTIVQDAQDIAGDKGVSIFTGQFDKAATDYAQEATTWLKVTTGIFAVTAVAIVIFMYQLWETPEWYAWASRAALIAVLVTAGLWCGSTYRILRHQETVNQHKANGLKSFLVFRGAADNDEATRNAVLMETTKAIFSTPKSGFIQEQGSQGEKDVHIIDARTIGTLGAAARTAGKSGTSE